MKTSIFSLSEIAVSIGHHLERGDLSNCVLVNSSWFQVFTTCLWRNVQQAPRWKGMTMDSIIEDAIVTNNRHIRTFRTEYPPLFTALLKYCTHLRHISVSDSFNIRSLFERDTWVNEIFLPAIGRNPGLETLILKCFPRPSMPDHDPQSLIRRLLEPLQNLTTLHLKFNYTIEHETFLYLAKLAKQLQRLYISFPTIHIDGESSEESGIEIPEIEQTRLIEFGLDSDYAKIDLYIILILKAAPELETLLMPTFDPTRVGLITSAVRQYCPRIRDLSLGQTITDPEVTDIISSCTTGLRSFAMVNNGGFGLATMKQLFLNNWKSLTSVILEAVGLDQFRMVQDILSSCPNLREFCIDEVFMEENSGRFAVKEILKKPWVCVKLELFRVPLAGIYGSIGGEESQDQGEDYHRALYIQLAKLSRLQELDVGFSLWSEPICTTMPRFSLESGLELLEGLKELRTLVLNFTVNGTQRQELEWMCEHWPNLTRIDGIIIEEAKLWWGLKSKDNDGDDTSMPKRIRNILTACDTRYTDICFNFGR